MQWQTTTFDSARAHLQLRDLLVPGELRGDLGDAVLDLAEGLHVGGHNDGLVVVDASVGGEKCDQNAASGQTSSAS